MGGWNYRLVRKKVDKNTDGTPYLGEEMFQIAVHEAYCDETGKVWAISMNAEEPITFDGETEYLKSYNEDMTPAQAIKQQLEWMLKACDKPVLDYDKIPEEGAITPGGDDDEICDEDQAAMKTTQDQTENPTHHFSDRPDAGGGSHAASQG